MSAVHRHFHLLRPEVAAVSVEEQGGRFVVFDKHKRQSLVTAEVLWAMRGAPALLCWSVGDTGIVVEELIEGLHPKQLIVGELGPTTVEAVRLTRGMLGSNPRRPAP